MLVQRIASIKTTLLTACFMPNEVILTNDDATSMHWLQICFVTMDAIHG